MSFIVLFLLTCILHQVVFGGVVVPFDESLKNESHCFATRKNIGEMTEGEQKLIPEECGRVTCLEDRSVLYDGCIVPMILDSPRPCQIVQDPSKKFPECCPRVECD